MTEENNTHHEIITSTGRKINHTHLDKDGLVKASTDKKVGSHIMKPLKEYGSDEEIIEDFLKRRNMFADVSESPEIVGGPTFEFNCHGKTLDDGKSWIEDAEVSFFLSDDYKKISESEATAGDVAVYTRDNKIVHSGYVHKTDGNGKVTRIQSKWGYGPELIHDPLDVPLRYGKPEYWRKKQ